MAVTDNFTGTDDAALDSGKWVIALGTFVYKSNQAYPGFSQNNLAKWIADTFANDHTSQVIRTAGSSYAGLCVRLTGTTSGDISGYMAIAHPTNCSIYRVDNGSFTDITNGPSGGIGLPATTGSNPQTYYMSAVGSAITLREGGAAGTIIATASSATYGTGAPGIYGNDQGLDIRMDDWEGTGEVGGGGATSLPPLIHRLMRFYKGR